MTDQRVPKVAVLLAAGRGSRLRPFTDETPKCLLRVNNRPILDYVLDSVVHAGFEHVYIVVHHLREQIISNVAATKRGALKVRFCYQPRLNGTAKGLSTSRQSVSKIMRDKNSFLISATDYAMPPNYITDLVSFHKSHSCAISISLREIASSQFGSSSAVVTTAEGGIARIIEKPDHVAGQEGLAASLLYIVPFEVYRYLPLTPLSTRGEFELPDTVNLMISDGYCAKGFVQGPLADLDDTFGHGASPP